MTTDEQAKFERLDLEEARRKFGREQRLVLIRHAVKCLSAFADSHWTPDELPAIKAVEFVSGARGLTREDIELAAKGFTRNNTYGEQVS